ncbi:hypothetical protein IMSAGC009_01171 [Lachnospiraceae bacterium]|nr:hypothetical protein IMSAGC009_01171 [Lachnospiraceae bacterium]
MNEYRMNDVDIQEFLHSFRGGSGKLPSDFDQLKTEGHYLIHWDSERAFCLKEREIYLKDTMENLLARSLCFFSDMPVSFAVHVKASGRADIEVLDNRKLSAEIKEKQVKGKSITVTYTDGTIDKGPLKTEKYIKGPFGEKVNTIHYACVADTLLSLRRKVYSASYEAVNDRSLSAAVREIHRKRERTLPVKPPGVLRGVMEDLKLLLSIRQTSYQHGLPDEERIFKFKEQMKQEGYIRISPELAVQAKKFRLPRFTVQRSGNITFAHDIQPGDKASFYLMKKDWVKMLDILINEKPVYCSRELLVAMKQEAKVKASGAKTEKDAEIFYSIDGKLSCFLEEINRHNLSHILKGQTGDRELPEFISPEERKELSKLYRFPERKVISVADRSPRYLEAMGR